MRLLHLTKFENKRLIIKYLVIAMPSVRIADYRLYLYKVINIGIC
jgi:hypothetical protein